MKPCILEALSDGQALSLGIVSAQGNVSQKILLPDEFDDDTLVVLQVYIDQDLPPSIARYVQAAKPPMQMDLDFSLSSLTAMDSAGSFVSTVDIAIPDGEYEATLSMVEAGAMQCDEQLQTEFKARVAQLGIEALGKDRYEKAAAEKEKCVQQGCLVILVLVLAILLAAWLLPGIYKIVAILFIAILFVCERLLFDPTKDIGTLCQIEEAQAPYYFAEGVLQLKSKHSR